MIIFLKNLSVGIAAVLTLSATAFASQGCNFKGWKYKTYNSTRNQVPHGRNFYYDMNLCGIYINPHQWHCPWVTADDSWIIPSENVVVFTADRWGHDRYNVFTYHKVLEKGCVDPEYLLGDMCGDDMCS